MVTLKTTRKAANVYKQTEKKEILHDDLPGVLEP